METPNRGGDATDRRRSSFSLDSESARSRPIRILVAEDDEDMRDLLAAWLRGSGYDVTTCSDGLELRSRLQMSVLSDELLGFDVVVSDIQMPMGSAFDVLDEFWGCEGVPPTILITAFGGRGTRAVARHLGAARVLEKPFDRERLLGEIESLRAATR